MSDLTIRGFGVRSSRSAAGLTLILAMLLHVSEVLAQGETTRHERSQQQSLRQRFKGAKSFYTYYGAGKTDELSRFDVVVLHPKQMTSENVKAIFAKGPITVGYITIGEDEELQVGSGKGPGGKASWYFDRDHDDVPDQDGIWKSWYTNANDPEWR